MTDLGAVAACPLHRSDAVRHLRARTPTAMGFLNNVALMWLAIGIGGLIFRTVHLFFLKDVQTGLVWATKILTDPFHDIKLYYKAPLYLARGELIDPRHGQHHLDDERCYARRRTRARLTAARIVILAQALQEEGARTSLREPVAHLGCRSRLQRRGSGGRPVSTCERISRGICRLIGVA